jgi:hypothetical protein
MKKGTQIVYTPDHANGDINHPDSERGFVAHSTIIDDALFCRYWRRGEPLQLRTLANSELTPIRNIIELDTVQQEIVNETLKEIDS